MEVKSLDQLQQEATTQFDDQVVELFHNDPNMNCRKAATILKSNYWLVYRASLRRNAQITEIKQEHR